jgi:hypothetical protein
MMGAAEALFDSSRVPDMRMFFSLLLAGLLAAGANAGEVRKLAILSALGGTLTVVTHRMETGSNLDRNQHEALETGDTALDTLAVNAVTEAIKSSTHGHPELQALIFPGQHDTTPWFDGKRFVPPDALRSALAETGATHLLLIVRHRAASMLKTRNASMGSGHLEGLGFYLDREQKLRRADTGQIGTGFLAPYAYLKLLLIDLASGEVEREHAIAASRTISAARNKDGFDPWQSLDAAQKLAAISALMRGEFKRALPELLPQP